MSLQARSNADWKLWLFLAAALLLPAVDLLLPADAKIAGLMPTIFVYAIMGLGLNIVTGFTGLLQLGAAAFVAIGAYTYSILTWGSYPFHIGFWPALVAALVAGAGAGVVLGLPTMRLRGDYLALVTLGFGEIVQDVLRNLDPITNGTQSINPVPYPNLFGYDFVAKQYLPFYYLYLALLVGAVVLCLNLRDSRVGRQWLAVREDELAARACGVNTAKAKLVAFSAGAALCSVAGALLASLYGTSIDPGYYDFQLSILALCIVIVGGLGSIRGVLLGALIMGGFNSIVLDKLSRLIHPSGDNVFANPTNWKYLVFGLALILMMRWKPAGLLPEHRAETNR